MKAYAIITSPRFASRPALQTFLDRHPRVAYWYACFPGVVFAFTEMTAHDLAKELEARFGTGAGRRFLVTEVSPNRQGRLPKDLWDRLRNPAQTLHKP